MSRSRQMTNIMRRYGVTTRRALLRAIATEYTEETGEYYSLTDAEMMLDGMLEAEYQRIEGGAYEPLPTCDNCAHGAHWGPVSCATCARDGGPCIWVERDPSEVYGTPEHEAWLIEMERMEG